LDLFAREGLLEFLRRESEEKGATIFYATHIFDYLAHWATHIVFFSKAKIARCCAMSDLEEYHSLVAKGVQCPLYSLMKEWVLREYDQPMELDVLAGTTVVPEPSGPVLEAKDLSYSYVGGSPQLKNVSFAFGRGASIIVVGANGAGKTTLLSILGGKRMIRRGFAEVNGRDCFNDSVGSDIMYCGDWWRTKFMMNLTFGELLGEDVCQQSRTKHLAGVLQIDFSWKINAISDGQRRRCQLCQILSKPRPVYLMDEITSDLDLFAREGILAFLKAECEIRGATVFYCTHIFDHLEGWATHLLHLSQGQVVRCSPMEEVAEYKELVDGGDLTPLYSLVSKWVHNEYGTDAEQAKPWRKVNDSEDGRMPNLGLAGPMLTCSG